VIVVPEKVVFIKTPKSASTTIANLFWSRHQVDRGALLGPEVATAIRYLVCLDGLAPKIPVLNGNWFYNRSLLFGWHASYEDLTHIFGDRLNEYHWIASVRHPVARLFSVYSSQLSKGHLIEELTPQNFEAFCERVFSRHPDLSLHQCIHTASQSSWLPPVGKGPRVSLVRKENLAEDIARLSKYVPSFQDCALAHENLSFKGDLARYVSPALAGRIEDFYAEDMERLKYRSLVREETGVSQHGTCR